MNTIIIIKNKIFINNNKSNLKIKINKINLKVNLRHKVKVINKIVNYNSNNIKKMIHNLLINNEKNNKNNNINNFNNSNNKSYITIFQPKFKI